MNKGFLLTTDAIIAIGFVFVLAGAITVMAQNSPADVYVGNANLARDYLVLKYADGISITPSSAIIPAPVSISESPPPVGTGVVGNGTYWRGSLYWPGYWFNCSTPDCFLNKTGNSGNVSMFYTQDEFNGSKYYYQDWAWG